MLKRCLLSAFIVLSFVPAHAGTLSVTPCTSGCQSVSTLDSNSYNAATASVGTSAAVLVAARTGRLTTVIYNTSGSAIRIGNSGVTATSGLTVPAGGAATVSTAAAIYAILVSGTTAVNVDYSETY